MNKELICITCPIGCRLTVKNIDGKLIVSGNQCKRGEAYGIKEMTNPTRIIPTTVKIKGAFLRRLPVKTSKAVPKDKIFHCMKEINKVEVQAPVKIGDVIIKNLLGLGVDVVATKEMDEI
ncbi:DUF1667 domain-containing protein [Anaeromicrobium sediminis]|uniref:Molybdopterin oxidoreductase n=1 Tax=Anaeromicrobium sediminis TaxID=1478221 RepID=A0A267MNZ2_9FIRM|nr:DUF1667 domain-containing protein [Anaeromicrobium sediminis]PAB60615.1 molybdopterin oxidoreductase [Anaeromicrobium sediminis]